MMKNTLGVIVEGFRGRAKIMTGLKITRSVHSATYSPAAKPVCEHYSGAQRTLIRLRLSKRRH